MDRMIVAFAMLALGIFQVFSGWEYGLILGNIWVVGFLIMIYMPKD